MTEQEARDILFHAKICDKHGCRLIKYEGYNCFVWHCPKCQEAERSRFWVHVQEALQVLGLPLKPE